MSEVTIGASIPIKTTLNDILLSGDAISSIIGLMSVSVNTVLSNMCDRGMSFSESVQTTYNSGLFESSVFEDLDGTEAAQKLLILAREIGIPLSIEDVEVDSLAFFRPVENWKTLCEDGIFAEEDAIMKEKVAIAKKRGCTLKFIQRISLNPPVELGSNQKVTARVRTKLEEVSLDSKYAEISGPVYYFAFHTARYSQSPLIIQGPLSDSMNTASGMVGDILRIARSIGARDTGPEVFKTKS
jgi:aspartokinase/homoserine dehydrogenase 1